MILWMLKGRLNISNVLRKLLSVNLLGKFRLLSSRDSSAVIFLRYFLGAPNRDAEFSEKAANFVEHGKKLADTASLVANFGSSSADKQLLDQINDAGQEVLFRLDYFSNIKLLGESEVFTVSVKLMSAGEQELEILVICFMAYFFREKR